MILPCATLAMTMTLVGASSTGVPVSRAAAAEVGETTSWFGGFGRTTGNQPRWTPVFATLHPPHDGVAGTLEAGNAKLALRGSFDEGRLAVHTELQGTKLAFSGSLEDDVILGTCQQGDDELEFHLLPHSPLTPDQLDRWCGLFELGSDHQLAIVNVGVFNMAVDFRSGELRALRNLSDHELTGGPLLAPQYPVAWRLDADDSGGGRIDSFTLERVGREPQVAKRIPYEQEEFRYRADSDGIEIVGTLSFPSGEGPHPGVVYVHGSGRMDRRQATHHVPFLIGQGFAVLAVDKRGVGESGGNYTMPDGSSDTSPAHFRRRGEDVRSALHALRAHPRVAPDKVGLFGISQAGWVMPVAASDPACAFTVTLSGGAAPVSQEDLFSRLANEAASGADLPSIESLLPQIRKAVPKAGDDFYGDFARQACPGLWLYGLKDRSNPSQLCIELLTRVATDHDKDFTIEVFENANHPLIECRFGGSAESMVSSRMVPGLWSTIAEWLSKRVQ